MSINVTVSGNPISIKRGKLITTDTDCSKSEFDKRRRLRLEQVRNQSREIAENVRNKVRKEKKRQLSDFEKQEEERHKKWQNRKLLELQEQYSESLRDIGAGHAQAAVESKEDALENEHKENQKKKAHERGDIAKQKLEKEKNKKNIKKAIPLQNKKLSRDIENARSTMVSKSKNSPFKRRKKKTRANINITANASGDSLTESEVDHEVLCISNSDSDSSLEEQDSGARRKRTKSRSSSPSSTTDMSHISPVKYSKHAKHISKPHSMKQHNNKSDTLEEVKSLPTTIPDVHPTTHYSMDTRISDRIRNRKFLLKSTVNESDLYTKETTNKYILENEPFTHTSEKHTDNIHSSTTENYQEHIHCTTCKCTCDNKQIKKNAEYKLRCCECNNGKTEIPVKPTVSLKKVAKNKEPEIYDNKVQYYDHTNRFSKEYISSKANVHKISEGSIEICPSTSSENEFLERIYKQDRDAQMRGQKAMEKVNIHKDYKEMMKQLPVLQRQERLASIATNKPIFHMSDERLREYEMRKQNQMEDAYEKLFPKTITIPPKKHVYEDEPFTSIDAPKATPSNGAHWDVNSKPISKGFTLTKDAGIVTIEADTSSNKENYLKYLLERLKVQKEMLLKEVASLPKNSNLNNIIQSLENLKNSNDAVSVNSETSPRKPSAVSVDSNMADNGNKAAKEVCEKRSSKHKRSRQPVVSTSNSSTSSTPPKKIKYKKYKIILQNTSTQTSPKIDIDKNDNKENARENLQPKERVKDKNQVKKPMSKASIRSFPKVRSDDSRTKISRPTSTKKNAEKDQTTSPMPINQYEQNIKSNSKDICRENSIQDTEKSDLCEILIKIKDSDEAEIQVKSPKKQRNLLVKDFKDTTDKEILKIPFPSDEGSNKVSKRIVTIYDEQTQKGKKAENSWKEHLSKSDAVGTSTSTSYYSPPEFSKSDGFSIPGIQTVNNYSDPSIKSFGRKKKIDSKLLAYIKKLLTMSRTSIEDLGVSTVTDVSTPTGSLLENSSTNDSLNPLRNIIKYFNLNPDELAQVLNYSEDSRTTTNSLVDNNFSTASTVHSSGYEGSKSQVNNITNSLSDQSKIQQSKVDSSEAKTNSLNSNLSGQSNIQERSLSTPVVEYAELAKLCQKRISDLSAMIEKVRLEKQQILSPTQSDKENSTQYLKLPSHLEKESTNLTNETSTTNSELEQAEINRRMLDIDYALAEKLKSMTHQELMNYNKMNDATQMDATENDLLERYRKLLSDVSEKVPEKNIQASTDTKQPDINHEISNSVKPDSSNSVSFVPVLSDVPRLPKLIFFNENNESSASTSQNNKHKKPPPSKGLAVAQKFNDNVAYMPHELSTIVEVDSQLSTKMRLSTSPTSTKNSPIKVFDTLKPVIILPEFPTNWTKEKHEEDVRKVSDGSVPDLVAQITNNDEKEKLQKGMAITDPNIVTLDVEPLTVDKRVRGDDIQTLTVSVPTEQNSDTSTDKSEMENIEKMLQSMGMGWAIATLRKTQAALTKSSSSSSVEALSKHQLSNNTSSSDVTLRDMLGKRIFSNSASASLSQSISPNLTKILFDLSAIQGSGPSSEAKHQRTSTPVQTTKSSESKKGIFTGESEVSSVKLSEEAYITMRDTTGNHSE